MLDVYSRNQQRHGHSVVFFLMIRRPPRSTLDRSSAASDVYKRQLQVLVATDVAARGIDVRDITHVIHYHLPDEVENLSLIHISEPTRPY